MLSVNASGSLLRAINHVSRAEDRFANTATRLATGLRINSGSDDPAGLIGAEQLRGALSESAARRRSIGAERSQARVQQSGRGLALRVLQNLRGLATQATGDTVSDQQRAAIPTEIDSSLDGLDRITNLTGLSLSSSLETLRSGGEASIDAGSTAAATELLEAEINRLATEGAEQGAYEKYTLDVEQRLAEDLEVVTAESLSRLADTDYAAEATNLRRDEILFRATLKTLDMLNGLRGEGLLRLLDVTV